MGEINTAARGTNLPDRKAIAENRNKSPIKLRTMIKAIFIILSPSQLLYSPNNYFILSIFHGTLDDTGCTVQVPVLGFALLSIQMETNQPPDDRIHCRPVWCWHRYW